MKRIFIFLVGCGFAATIGAQTWPDVKNEAKAGARWWWLGSAVDKENLQWNLKQYADHGIGSLEITPIYGVQGNDANNIPYLSDKWMSMFREAQVYGKALGIEIDMATGTGWPFGGPWVPMEESANKVVFVDTTFTGGSITDLLLDVPFIYESFTILLFYLFTFLRLKVCNIQKDLTDSSLCHSPRTRA